MEQTFEFSFTMTEANTILQALGQLPYVQVAGLIENIKQQATPQVQGQQPQAVNVDELA